MDLKEVEEIYKKSEQKILNLKKNKIKTDKSKIFFYNRILILIFILAFIGLISMFTYNSDIFLFKKVSDKVFNNINKNSKTMLDYIYTDKIIQLKDFLNEDDKKLIAIEKIVYDFTQKKYFKAEANALDDLIKLYKQFRVNVKKYAYEESERSYQLLLQIETDDRLLQNRIESIKRNFFSIKLKQNKRVKK